MALTEPRIAMLAMCVECGQGIEVPLPVDARMLAVLLAQRGWFSSVLTPPGQGTEAPILIGPLCNTCAPQIYSPDVHKAAEERRKQLLLTVQPEQEQDTK